MIKIKVNDQAIEVSSACSLQDALLEYGYKKKSNAVAINKNFIPQHQYSSVILQLGDEINIVAPMQGG